MIKIEDHALDARLVDDPGGPVVVVAEDGQAWDPDRRAFAAIVRAPEYRAITRLRTEALVEPVLQPTTPAAV